VSGIERATWDDWAAKGLPTFWHRRCRFWAHFMMDDNHSVERVAFFCLLGASLFFLLPGIFIIAYNYLLLILNWRKEKKASLVLIFGSLSTSVGLLLFPATTVRLVCWLPFLLDPGCWVLAASLLRGCRGAAGGR